MRRNPALFSAIAAVTLAACTVDPTVDDSIEMESSDEITLTVLAAASLQDSFDAIAEEFSATHPEVSIEFNYAGSSTLVQNLEAGAPADVFASADEANMDNAAEAGLIGVDSSEIFAANTLVGVVPADNPAGVSTLQEANAADSNLVVCAPQVPCGALAHTVAGDLGITLDPVSEEHQVTDVLGKVRSGEADAGLVYATDAALAADEVEVFDIPGAEQQHNHYPIARTAHSEQPDAAEAFIDFVHSGTGQDILEAHGFQIP